VQGGDVVSFGVLEEKPEVVVEQRTSLFRRKHSQIRKMKMTSWKKDVFEFGRGIQN
jgi:hypothetical protein